MPKANPSHSRSESRGSKDQSRHSSNWTRHIPPSRCHYVDSYRLPPEERSSDLRRSEIPDHRRDDYYSHLSYPPPLMNIPTSAESDIDPDSKKSIIKNIMKSLATFMVQAHRSESDLDLLRDALVDIVAEKEGNSTRRLDEELFNSLVKRVEICETRLPDTSTIERLNALEQKINSESSSLIARIERLEGKIFPKNVENDCEIVETPSNFKKNDLKRPKLSSQPTSSLFPTPAVNSEPIASNSFLSSKCQKLTPKIKDKGDPGFESLADRLASVIENKLTSDNVLLKRLESLESHMKEQMLAFTEKIFSPQQDGASLERPPRLSVPRTISASSDSDSCQPEEIEIKQEKAEPMTEPPLRFIMDPDDFVVIHTDGIGNLKSSTRGNPGVRVWFGENHALNLSRPVDEQTSNKGAQLLATYAALSQSNQAGLSKVRVYTSSAYIIKCFQKFSSWSERDWMTSKDNKLRMKHADHFKEIFQFLNHIQTDFKTLMEENCARSMDITVTVKSEPS